MSGNRPLPPDFSSFFNIFRQFALATPQRVSAAVALVLAVTGVTTGVLARDYHVARRQQAAEYFATAERDLVDGQPEAAALHYRAALSLERDNAQYRRQLAVTLLDLRLIGEAESRLDDLLAADPIDGEANLLRGRLAAGRGNWREAEAYYQRAIYGRWPDTLQERRLSARYELVELFEQVGAVPQARAELLRLQSELPDVPFLQEDAARRFLRLNDAEQAANVLRRTLATHPASAWLAAHLSRAELAAGRLTEARDAARRAVALDPGDRETRARLAAISEALALDPNARGLSTRERYRRSGLLLTRAIDRLEECLGPGSSPSSPLSSPSSSSPSASSSPSTGAASGGTPAAASAAAPGASPAAAPAARPAAGSDDALRAQLAIARAQSAAQPPRGDEAIEDQSANRIALAEQIWRARVRRCGAIDEPIAKLYDRLSR